MKKVILSLIVTFTFSTIFASGEFEKAISDKEFEKIQKIETFVEAHPEVTSEDLLKTNSELLTNVTLLNETSTTSINAVQRYAYSWRILVEMRPKCVGLVLVYFSTDRDQVKKALVGYIIGTLLFGVGGLLKPFAWLE